MVVPGKVTAKPVVVFFGFDGFNILLLMKGF